jgi:two-component system cell cycle response regulator
MSTAGDISPSKILVVEDDDDLRRGVARQLHAWGYEVVAAADAYGAVSVARAERPDLVLLDLGLPGGGGFTVLERYAQLPSVATTPIVILTGRDPRAAEPVARRFEVAAFLTKPVENAVLRATIERALHGEPTPSAAPPATPAEYRS